MSNNEIPEIDVEELANQPDGQANLYDVREADEYVDGHVPGAILIPLSELTERVGEFPTDGPVRLICRSGGRSMQAATYLVDHGVDPINVAGGTLAWIESGRTVVTGVEPG